MISNFDLAVTRTIQFEGGYSNDPDDRGGETNYGISAAAYPELDIANIKRHEAIKIYYRDYWLKYHCNEIVNEAVAARVFDAFVNHAPKTAGLIVQHALSAAGKRVKWDGIVGPVTLAAINTANQDALVAALRSERAGYYRALILGDPVKEKYKTGWLKRAYA